MVDTTAAGDTGNRHRLTSSLSYETSYLYKSLVFGNFCRLFFALTIFLIMYVPFFFPVERRRLIFVFRDEKIIPPHIRRRFVRIRFFSYVLVVYYFTYSTQSSLLFFCNIWFTFGKNHCRPRKMLFLFLRNYLKTFFFVFIARRCTSSQSVFFVCFSSIRSIA